MSKVRELLRQPTKPYLLLVSGLIIVTLLTALGGMWHYQYDLKHTRPSAASGVIARLPSTQNSPTNPAITAILSTPNPTSQTKLTKPTPPTQSTHAANQLVTTQSGQSAPAASTPTVTMVSVALSVNSAFAGNVNLSSSSNQCDVLSQALSAGVINNLDMRYNSQYKTNAVYVINDIGDSDAVWWTYTVNGKSPPYGCGLTQVHNGDAVNWQYVKK